MYFLWALPPAHALLTLQVKRADGVQTKAYKEPSKKKSSDSSKPREKSKLAPAPRIQIQDFGRRLGTRTSTALKTADTIKVL